jgi:hypothetical protein
MRVATRKISITVDSELVDEVKARVGARGVSGFFSKAVADAIEAERENEGLDELLAYLEEKLGPPKEEDLAWAEQVIQRAEAAQRASFHRSR